MKKIVGISSLASLLLLGGLASYTVNSLKANNEIPELLDPEIPQQLLVSAFRRYRR